jgi:hypothetical protein
MSTACKRRTPKHNPCTPKPTISANLIVRNVDGNPNKWRLFYSTLSADKSYLYVNDVLVQETIGNSPAPYTDFDYPNVIRIEAFRRCAKEVYTCTNWDTPPATTVCTVINATANSIISGDDAELISVEPIEFTITGLFGGMAALNGTYYADCMPSGTSIILASVYYDDGASAPQRYVCARVVCFWDGAQASIFIRAVYAIAPQTPPACAAGPDPAVSRLLSTTRVYFSPSNPVAYVRINTCGSCRVGSFSNSGCVPRNVPRTDYSPNTQTSSARPSGSGWLPICIPSDGIITFISP